MFRALLIGIFIAGAGCPHPTPPVQPPTPVVFDGGAADVPEVVGCGINNASQDAITGRVVNAGMASSLVDMDRQMMAVVMQWDLPTVRCVVADILLDLRSAPKLEARLRSWMASNGGAP